MSTPYGGNDPQQWSGQPQQGQPQYGQQPGYPPQHGQQPQYAQPPQHGQPPGYAQPQYGQPYPGQAPSPHPGAQQYPGQQQFPGQGTPAGYGQQPPKKNSAKGLLTGVGALVVVVAAFCVTAFLAPGFLKTTVLSQTAVQDGVKQVLTGNYQLTNVGSVSCPADQEVVAGRTFDCATTVDGKGKTVTVTIKDDAANYEVAYPR
ncbi:DUF4333 domain-containing protein [Amycolatopsis thermophila]|uniref:DUF4333 domain-containing protein n=1 Tax=Amycolatopsis thermophila TaxID=206084 RepID=A0ABU0F3T4_9PSEU|nr:DUF4333 domain-containing protein [Amycolatopsis thermophila]MDQ0381745.1 hypothetical protein [Amycolatopsis thermophila]